MPAEAGEIAQELVYISANAQIVFKAQLHTVWSTRELNCTTGNICPQVFTAASSGQVEKTYW